jgi:quinol monooxygenase YgiN
METIRAFGSGYWFGPQTGKEGPWVAPLFTAGILFYLAILTHRARQANSRAPLLRNLIIAYITITGIVELTRFVWDVSRFALVWAALHNLAEWGVIGFTVFQTTEADRHWWRSQLWILLVSQWILFAPTLFEGGLGEQIVGLLCDWLLLFVWGRLYFTVDPVKKKYILFGFIASIGHMLEILPLVSLLIGLVPVPSTPGCLLISFTTPITFWFYSRMVDGFDASGDDDLVSSQAKDGRAAQNHALPLKQVAKLVAIALVCAVATIIGPAELISVCPPKDMKVPPGAVLAHDLPATPGMSLYTGTGSGLPVSGKVPQTTVPAANGAAGAFATAGSNESLCVSNTKLTGTTTVVAKPGQGVALRNMIATMPGPIRQEDGNLYYEEAYGGADGLTVKFFESWSSIRSLYKHIYMSPTVRRVFFSEAFRNLVANQVLEGPFQAMVPCSEAEKEAQPVTIPFSTVIDAPVECLWAKIDAWSTDYSWVQHAQGITPVTPTLRILHFKTTDVPVIRQTAPLSEPEQPAGGHRLIYYMLGGGFLDTIGEVYRGDLSIRPSAGDPSKTLFEYSATIVAKDPSLTTAYFNSVFNDFTQNRVPFLQSWGRDVGDGAACKAMPPPKVATQ